MDAPNSEGRIKAKSSHARNVEGIPLLSISYQAIPDAYHPSSKLIAIYYFDK